MSKTSTKKNSALLSELVKCFFYSNLQTSKESTNKCFVITRKLLKSPQLRLIKVIFEKEDVYRNMYNILTIILYTFTLKF